MNKVEAYIISEFDVEVELGFKLTKEQKNVIYTAIKKTMVSLILVVNIIIKL